MGSHPIVHIEIPANDPSEAAKFYADLFGWQSQHSAELNYTVFTAEGGPGGGFPAVDGDSVQPDKVLISVATDDIDATLARVESLGGSTVVPKTEIPSVGWFGVFVDPTGNRIGLYTGLQGES